MKKVDSKKTEKNAKRKIDFGRYISATAITLLIFILGIFLGNYIANFKLSEVEKTQEELTAQLVGLELKDILLKGYDICSLSWQEIWKEKVETGDRISRLEARLGKGNPDVLRQQEVYELIEIRTWLLLKEIKEKCGGNFSIILYFYTNKEDDPKGSWRLSESQGYVLDAIYQHYPNKVNIFAFDINTKNPATDILQQIHNITTVPSMVINEKLYQGYKNFPAIEEILGLK